MRTFVCVLKSGGDYFPEHVQILQNQVRRAMPSTERFVCLTDYESIADVETIPLELGLRGKYSMMEAFRITGEVVVTGIDTVLVGDLDRIWDVVADMGTNDFYMMKSFNRQRRFGNNPMAWNGDWSRLVYKFDVETCYRYQLEQEYTVKKLETVKANIKVMNDHFTIRSYKHAYLKGNAKLTDSEFLIFHGKPRPHEVEEEWIKKLYQ